ncbi:hypothetical protein GUJ93_ZPchr0012g20783 [Zizania palustris]|uniref:non-specific serine/threonine protein kinase n=1 Tax=Zizania palustris TaxID=103762 RepID=A0A8J5WMT1_ZIZPA|nr:hypothetical protein GUJ93_ZPchr0012g20783 [Zizania palustris]
MGKTTTTSSSWSSLFGLGCFSASHSDGGSTTKNKQPAAATATALAPAPLPAPRRPSSCNNDDDGGGGGGVMTMTMMPSPEDLSLSLAGSGVQAFTVEELRTATRDFSVSNFVGEGGFGPVYKGYVDERLKPGVRAQAVAVKLLDLEGSQGHKEWLAEVIFLGQLRHPHLVKLIGYCYEDEHRLLVYEFMARGSLEKQLFKSMRNSALKPS